MTTTIHNVKASELPAHWREQANVEPDEILQITIRPESEAEDEELPPEENFRSDYVSKIEQSTKDYSEGKRGEFTTTNTIDEVRTLLNNSINE